MRREFYLIRHGQTDWNLQKRWQGQTDVPLNEEGHRQAQLLAAHMRQHHTVHALYASDLSRAYVTAQVIGSQIGLEPIIDHRLRETNVGVFEGLTRAEIAARYPDDLRAFDDVTLMTHAVPQGESRLMVQNRADNAFRDITRNTHGNVAFVSHGAWIGLLLGRMFPQHTNNGMFPIHNTSISTVALEEGEWELVSVSETPHLV
ncbi:MAG: histidine phosphatase family protein [Anaerolineae bacterium]|nr:histidine phosphatase family protein [Anaerolineae bacterium]